ncbi:MAG TPA: hypothetical protein VKP66_02450 [Steroidobacteraceae bacterium]|nr:hypothetical protein [Steroidobacteraceae bacterium]
MRAALAFLNGAGSRGTRRSGSTDRGLLALTNLLVNPGLSGRQFSVAAELEARTQDRARVRRPHFKR